MVLANVGRRGAIQKVALLHRNMVGGRTVRITHSPPGKVPSRSMGASINRAHGGFLGGAKKVYGEGFAGFSAPLGSDPILCKCLT